EHNLDVIRNADWILDLGPEGGEDGGRIVGQGRPAKIAATPGSYTGQFLTRYYASSNGKLAAIDLAEDPLEDGHPEDDKKPVILSDRSGAKGVEGPAVPAPTPAQDSSTPKPKRTRRNTPAEDDLAATRAKSTSTAQIETNSKPNGHRQKKTGK